MIPSPDSWLQAKLLFVTLVAAESVPLDIWPKAALAVGLGFLLARSINQAR